MKIERVTLYRVELPLARSCILSGGRDVRIFDATLVALETDTGLVGWGETCPWGRCYLPAFAEGNRAGLHVLGPRLLGLDPLEIAQVGATMDEVMLGQPQLKSAVDIACWDLLGQATGQPVAVLLGGWRQPRLPKSAMLAHERGLEHISGEIARGRAGRVTHFEYKAHGDLARDTQLLSFIVDQLRPGEVLKVDANGGWRVWEAQQLMSIGSDRSLIFEQPCREYPELLALRKLTNRPISLDEGALTLQDVVCGFADGVVNVVNIKIGRVGGLSHARAMRDLCVGLRIPMFIQCTGGSEISCAAICHLAHSTPPELLLGVWDCAGELDRHIASGMADRTDYEVAATRGPGLGIEVEVEALGDPIACYESS